jgi:hypothetical protein
VDFRPRPRPTQLAALCRGSTYRTWVMLPAGAADHGESLDREGRPSAIPQHVFEG